jgi:hypothetical protein
VGNGQYSGQRTGGRSQGFLPIVMLDSKSNVYVMWIDRSGNFIYRLKTGDGWCGNKIIASGIDIFPGITSEKYFCAGFDSQDNLHLVFPQKVL